jgi:ANTAR domain
MTTSAFPERRSQASDLDTALRQIERLRAENQQLQRAVSSHATVDQAIGVLLTLGRIGPDDGFDVLREVSQRLNIKLSALAAEIIKYGQGADLPDPILGELHAALARRTESSAVNEPAGNPSGS